MSKGLAVILATILLLTIIVVVKLFDKEIRKSQRRKQGVILMFAVMVSLYIYAFIRLIGGF